MLLLPSDGFRVHNEMEGHLDVTRQKCPAFLPSTLSSIINIITVKQKPNEDNGMLPHIETQRDPVFQIHVIYSNINFLIDFLSFKCFSNFRKKYLVYKQDVKN